jgi:hypothetical protein
MSRIVRAALLAALMLSATTSELAAMNAPALAQTLNDWKCTGNPDIPWDVSSKARSLPTCRSFRVRRSNW